MTIVTYHKSKMRTRYLFADGVRAVITAIDIHS